MQALKYGPCRGAAAALVASIDDRQVDRRLIGIQEPFALAVLQRNAADADAIEFKKLRKTLSSQEGLLVEQQDAQPPIFAGAHACPS